MDAKAMALHPANPLGRYPGLEALYSCCRTIYPDQQNPLQVTARLKFWLGGPDPLDYVSMYVNPGDPDREIDPHWHYISFGLSDLHGDGRVHNVSTVDGQSGFGFELTFRLKREPEETAPPTWPAALMQSLAKYVFQSENRLYSGDHVSWHCSLDQSESRIQHMLMTEDPQLGSVTTPFGSVTFIQIIGVCAEEVRAAQGWNGPGVLELLRTVPGAGGPWSITDMRRGESVFELDPDSEEAVTLGIQTEGSNLSGVSARCQWSDKPLKLDSTSGSSVKTATPPVYDMSTAMAGFPLEAELQRVRTLDRVYLQFNLEAGTLLPLALRGRLKHGRHFTFNSVVSDTNIAITFVTAAVAGTFVDKDNPYAARGPWLQLLIDEEFLEVLLTDLSSLDEFPKHSSADSLKLPKVYEWPERKLTITLVQEEY